MCKLLYRGRRSYLSRTFKFYQIKHDKWNRLFGYKRKMSRVEWKKQRENTLCLMNKIRNYCFEEC